MNNLFDKFKKGVSDASNKAKTIVDVNKIKMQVSQKEKEIEVEYKGIGEIVFNAFKNDNSENIDELIQDKCNIILAKQEEIRQLNQKIGELNNEKECVCGRLVPIDTKFCPSCGHKFEEEVIINNKSEEVPPVEEKYVCSICNSEVEPGAKFCSKCGNPM